MSVGRGVGGPDRCEACTGRERLEQDRLPGHDRVRHDGVQSGRDERTSASSHPVTGEKCGEPIHEHDVERHDKLHLDPDGDHSDRVAEKYPKTAAGSRTRDTPAGGRSRSRSKAGSCRAAVARPRRRRRRRTPARRIGCATATTPMCGAPRRPRPLPRVAMRLETYARAGLPLIEFFVARSCECSRMTPSSGSCQQQPICPDGPVDLECEAQCREQVSARPSLLHHAATVASGCGIRGAIVSKG